MSDWPWPAPVPDDGAAHLLPGTTVPDVQRESTGGATLSLARLPGRVVLVIYPWTGAPGKANPTGWDDIPGAHGSTPELEGFARLYHGFAEVDVKLYGLSRQSLADQRDCVERLGLPFALLSDEDGELAKALRLPSFETGGDVFLKRMTLVLRDGLIETVYYPVHPPHTHAREVLYLCGATRKNAHLGR